MDAPLYPPSDHFEAPRILRQPMTTRDSSMADFIANPEAMAILKEEAPGAAVVINTPMLKPHLGNMSPRSLVQFGALKTEQVDRIDARLKAAKIMTGGSQ